MKRHIFWGITLSVWAAAVLLAVLAAYAVSGTVIETPFTLLFVAVFLAAPAAASIISRKITAPLAQIDPENPPDAEDYPELGDMLHRLHRQNELIGKQMNDLRRQREEFRAITENMDEGFILIDKETEILSYNASALRHLGRDKSGGGSVFDLNRSAPFCAAVGEALMGQHNEKTLEHDGRVYQLIANPVTENGQTDGAVIVILDITEKRQREQMRREFTSNVSHELKTPLAAIRNYGTLLQQPDLPDEKRLEYAKAITDSSRRLADMMTNILKLNRLENQQIFPQSAEFDLGEQLCECLLQFEDVWEQQNIAIETDICDDVRVSADAELLSLVWNNLFSNAFKFTPPGGTVSVKLSATQTHATVTVSDTGCGMSPETGAHIFEKFYQGDTSRATQGNGLGLALVKRVVDITQGEISVQSALGVGSSFTVKIRRA